MALKHSDRPLAGLTVLVTRARSQASKLAALVRAAGGDVYEFPLIRFAPPESWAALDGAIARLASYHWLVLTSVNGVSAFAERLAIAGLRFGEQGGTRPRVAAVGSATAAALQELGLPVDAVPPEFRGSSLPGVLAPSLHPGDRILMARGNLADPALAAALRSLGAMVDDVVAYRTLPAEASSAELRTRLAAGAIDYVTLTSSSTVHQLMALLGGPELLAAVRVACIGPETRKAAEAAGLRVAVTAARATLDELVHAIVQDRGGRNP